jgi:predicted short-subunit dehydrogenase-like oxidoreductase (DUF2520 family)
MLTLTIIGCGKVGKTLGYLLFNHHCCDIQDILCRSYPSSLQATHFIGAGNALSHHQELQPADIFLLAVNDDQLPKAVSMLATSHIITDNSLIFHCSGALPSSLLSPLKSQGAKIASLHPVKSFSQPEDDIKSFAGTVCTLEGDTQPCAVLKKLFGQLGADIIQITPDMKLLYHIATVFSSNYFVTLMDTALQLLQEAGIQRQQGMTLLQPLVMGSWHQLVKWGSQEALTGPISRGDSELVAAQLALLKQSHRDIAHVYQALGKLTLQLAEKKNVLSRDSFLKLEKVLSNCSS